jgi:hypothetical protein
MSAPSKRPERCSARLKDALREKIVYSSLKALNESGYQTAEQSFNPASSPVPSPPKDDDNVVFIIAFECEKKSEVHTII